MTSSNVLIEYKRPPKYKIAFGPNWFFYYVSPPGTKKVRFAKVTENTAKKKQFSFVFLYFMFVKVENPCKGQQF